MSFTIGGVKYKFNANAQIWPRALDIGSSKDKVYLVVANGGNGPVSSINGFVWLYVGKELCNDVPMIFSRQPTILQRIRHGQKAHWICKHCHRDQLKTMS